MDLNLKYLHDLEIYNEKLRSKKKNKYIVITFSLLFLLTSQRFIFAAANPADTTVLAAIKAQIATVIKSGQDMLKAYNEQISAVNNVVKAADKTKQLTEMIVDPDKNIFYVQGKQLSNYVKSFHKNKQDPFKVRLRTFNLESQELVQKYENLAYKYDNTERAWLRASKSYLPQNKNQELNKNPSNSGYIFAANQNVKDLYYRTKTMAYEQEVKNYEQKIALDGISGVLPIDKSEGEIFYESTKHLGIKIQIDQLKVLKEIHSTMVALLQVQSGNSPSNQSFPSLNDFKEAYDKATNGISLDEETKKKDGK